MKAESVARLLFQSKKTVAVAESCTAGLLGHTLTGVSGSSAYFIAGIIAYSNKAKIKLLRVSPLTLARKGAVSQETALAMAKNVRTLCQTDIGIATTGIAGPTGGSAQKPVGTVYIAIASPRRQYARRFRFKGSRSQIKNKTVAQALLLLKQWLR